MFQLKEVKVSYGDELEIILRQAATDRDFALVNKIFSDEIDMLDNWVRKRAFDYIEQGVMLKGDNVQQARQVVDKIKVTFCITVNIAAYIIIIQSLLRIIQNRVTKYDLNNFELFNIALDVIHKF